MEPRTFSYTPASAHRAAANLIKSTLPAAGISVVVLMAAAWQFSASSSMPSRIISLATVPATLIWSLTLWFFRLRRQLGALTYACSSESLRVGPLAISRQEVVALDVTATYFTVKAANRRAITANATLDEYPVLLDMIRSWNPPETTYRDIDLPRIALRYLQFVLVLALLVILLSYRF